jgi:cytochrome c5
MANMKQSFILLSMVLLTACSVKLIAPAQSDVARVSSEFPDYSLTALKNGQALFEHTCNRCHRLKNPASRNENKWRKLVPVMIGRLNKKEGRQVIDDKQQESILRYLITMSSARKSA